MIHAVRETTEFTISWEDLVRMIYNEFNVVIPRTLHETERFLDDENGKLTITWSKYNQIPSAPRRGD